MAFTGRLHQDGPYYVRRNHRRDLKGKITYIIIDERTNTQARKSSVWRNIGQAIVECKALDPAHRTIITGFGA